jgi:FkbM family methyltransferase
LKKLIKNIVQKFGYDILHLPTNPTAREQMHLMAENQIDLLFDIGANAGQFATKIRGMGYKGEIVSFEPLSETYKQLVLNAASDSNWKTENIGIGNIDGVATINVSANTYSSSLLDMLPISIESAPDSVYTHQEQITINKIDTIIDQFYAPSRNLYIKMDTQGFERQVFEGCLQSLDKIKGFQMELSLVYLYNGETLAFDMISLLRKEGFKLKLIEGGHKNYDTGELLQIEGYFFR